MKARRIATQRIGTSSTATPPPCKDREGTNLIWFGLFSAIVMIAASILALQTAQPDIVQPTTTVPVTTAVATSTSTTIATPSPTTVITPSVMLVTYGVALGDVWLRASPGGKKLPAALLAGQRVVVLEERGEFLKVQWSENGVMLTGWVTAKWVEVQ